MDQDKAGASVPSTAAGEDGAPKDRHEPRGRKPNDQLPPSRAREVQRAFRLRRAEHLAVLEERISVLELENSQLRQLLALPDADRARIGSGPTGRGKSLKEGGVPMSERVRARKEARARERAARGIVEPESSEMSDSHRDATASPATAATSGALPSRASVPPVSTASVGAGMASHVSAGPSTGVNAGVGVPLFSPPPTDLASQFSFNLAPSFHLPLSPDNAYDYGLGVDTGSAGAYKNPSPCSSFSLFNLFDHDRPASAAPGATTPELAPLGASAHSRSQPPPGVAPVMQNTMSMPGPGAPRPPESPISPPVPPAPTPAPASAAHVPQPELLTRLKACCHVSDSHVVNDPGLLIFATRLCQSTACAYGGHHGPDSAPASDADYVALDDAWRVLRATLEPAGSAADADGENRMNTGRMASELVTRAAASRGAASAGWIVCRFREGMSIRRSLVAGLVAGFGGSFE
ncbi:hypothetical protein Q5752_003187 [Cryptotrichosporon argae]